MPRSGKYDNLTTFIYMKIHKDGKLSIEELKSLGITYNNVNHNISKCNIKFLEDKFYINQSKGIDTPESNAAIKSYLLGEITRDQLCTLLDISNPTYRIMLYRKKYNVGNVFQMKEACREEMILKYLKEEIGYVEAAKNLKMDPSSFRAASYRYIKSHPECKEIIQEAKNRKKNQKDDLLMKYYRNEITMKEIAKILDCHPGYVSVMFRRFLKEKNLPRKDKDENGNYIKKTLYNDSAYYHLFEGYFSGKYSADDIARELNISRHCAQNYIVKFKQSHPDFENKTIRKKARCYENKEILDKYLNGEISIKEIMELGIFPTRQKFYGTLSYYRKVTNQVKKKSKYQENLEILAKYVNGEISKDEIISQSTIKDAIELSHYVYYYKIRHDIPVKKIKKKKEE